MSIKRPSALRRKRWRPPRPHRPSDPAAPVTGPTPRPESRCGSSFEHGPDLAGGKPLIGRSVW